MACQPDRPILLTHILDPSPQRQDRLSELRLGEVRHIQTDHDRRRRAEPPTRGRATDAEIRGDGDVAGAADEIPQPVVITLLQGESDSSQGVGSDGGGAVIQIRHCPSRRL